MYSKYNTIIIVYKYIRMSQSSFLTQIIEVIVMLYLNWRMQLLKLTYCDHRKLLELQKHSTLS